MINMIKVLFKEVNGYVDISKSAIYKYFGRNERELTYLWNMNNEKAIEDVKRQADAHLEEYGNLYKLEAVFINKERMDESLVDCFYCTYDIRTSTLSLRYVTDTFRSNAVYLNTHIEYHGNSMTLCLRDMEGVKKVIRDAHISKIYTDRIDIGLNINNRKYI